MANNRKTLEQTTGMSEEDFIIDPPPSKNQTDLIIDEQSMNNSSDPIDLNKPVEKKKTVSIAVGDDFEEPMNTTTTPEECTYIGDVYGEKKHGKGILSWADGRIYAGGFFADRRHGFGTFQDLDTSEFKGLYCQDERFGPGILLYNSLSRADVGLWLSENLIRLLYRHPDLNLDINVTDKRTLHSSSLIAPSWYSPQEILRTMTDIELVLQKKSSNLFCHDLQSDSSPLSRYLLHKTDHIQAVMHDRYAQLDAYLMSINEHEEELISKEKSLQQRQVEILPPNETFEQRQLYSYVNKFWPFKQRATFPIDEILSNHRSSFPRPGPIENASLALLEFAFDGDEANARDLLMNRLVYVDVCDARGLTALHMATYSIHLNIINLLLDFGANVNQLSDDGLTPLMLAFLLYYGNNPQQTINTALEHVDPPLPPPRVQPENEPITKGKSMAEEEKMIEKMDSMKIEEMSKRNSYGYEIKEKLRQRIDDEPFHQSVFTMICLLLRRGADPSMSDWPLPALALAVRAGDLKMVQLLLKKRAQVNCQLDAKRHAKLTPLHIACGCLEPTAVDIARVLLEYGAEVNAQSLTGNKEYFTYIDPVVKANVKDENGRTPLHIACTREASPNTVALVRLLLEYQADPNAVCNGQTPLTLAIALANEPVIDLLLNDPRTDPATVLGAGNGNALCVVLSTMFEARWPYQKRLKLIERLMAKNPKVLYPVRFGPKNTLGSCVDYTYYTYFADTRISQTPYHALTTQERVVYNERKELLAFIAKRFREEVSKHEHFLRLPTPTAEDSIQRTSPSVLFRSTNLSRAPSLLTEKTTVQSWRSTGEFRYCATCGRSIGVRLTLCKRCQKTAFCSKTCKVNGWNEFHRYECHRSSNINDPSSNRLFSRSKTFVAKPKDFNSMDRDFYKDNFSLKPMNKSDPSHRLPPVSVAKLLREKRLKKLHGSNPLTQCVSLEGIPLSWNHTYNAPENYSFN